MAKSKRKPAAAVKRPQVPLHAPVPSHTNQGGSLVLGIKSALGKLDGSISHIPRADLPPFPVVNQPSSTGTSTAKETDGSSVDHSNASLDGFLEDDRSEDKNLKKNNLISLVLSPVDTLVEASSAATPSVEISHIVPPPVDAPKLDAPIVPSESCVAQDAQPCSQATTAGSEEWQIIRKRRHSSGNK
ncbi:hypothetical protein NC652_016756 [Populus alba x Populus x berolinensis]|nr:hypothetical protein NC652_016756 [Populus alba x Populus x berolinensis]